MTPAQLTKLCLSLPDAHEEPHFDRTSFRLGKKIFATMTRDGGEAMVKVQPQEKLEALLETQPDVFFSYGGWTTRFGSLGVRLAKVQAAQMRELVQASYDSLGAKKKPAAKKKAAKKKAAKK